jgi:Tuberculosis necrotizing toxin
VSQPTPLNPVEQDALVKQIGLALMKAAPQDWEQVRAYYRAAGRYFELSAEITDQDGQSRAWTAPADTASLLARLRAGMYREGRGTWFNARYQLDRPSSYNLDFDRDEPQWQNPPPQLAYTDEMRFFPRTDDNVPEWLAARLQAPPPARPPMPPPHAPNGGGRLRTARIFDGPGPDGRPTVNRPPLDPAEVGKVLDYLEAAPVVMTGQGMDSDRLAHDNPESIPLAFHTDGTWIWPAAVIFYLARYGVPPEPDLVQHIRAANFHVPDVDEPAHAAATALLGTMVPGGRPVPPPPQATQMIAVPEPTQVVQPEPEPDPEPEPEPVRVLSEPPQAVHEEPEPEPEPEIEPEPVDVAGEQLSGASIDLLRRLLDDLNVPPSVYRLGEPAPNTWYLERVEDGWQVGWYEHGFSTPMLFDDDNDAAAFLLGKVLLNNVPVGHTEAEPSRHEAEPEPEPPAQVDIAPEPVPIPHPPAAPEPPRMDQPQLEPPRGEQVFEPPRNEQQFSTEPPRNEPTRNDVLRLDQPPLPRVAPAPSRPPAPVGQPPVGGGQPPLGQQQAGPRPDDWPIQPLRGEPPLTLFRGKRVIELQSGMEVDRFGQPDGNLTYAGGTPFPLRSLVPEWVGRPYHVYRLQQPVQALAGVAVPWFGQPGGGTAYLLPKSIDELLSDGTLVEVRHGTPPPTGQ